MAKFTRKSAALFAAIAIVAIAAAAGGYFALDGGKASAKTTNQNFAIYKDDRSIGNTVAPAVLIEYAAPSCPHCAHFNETVFPQLKKDYIDTGKVLYILRVYPISPADGAIELVARCLPKEKYFPYLDHLFHAQAQWDPEYGVQNVGDALKKLSAPFGIDAQTFDRCASDKNGPDRINRVAQDGQMRYGIQGVPTIILNGIPLQSGDITSYSALKAKIDAQLKK